MTQPLTDALRSTVLPVQVGPDLFVFMLVRHPECGKPVVPVALMLDQYHCWDPRDRRTWGGAYPYGRGEQMIDNFFNMAFPGQARGFYHDEWRKAGQPPQYPHERDMEKARPTMAEGLDTRPLEKGMLVPSIWGDSFDVVLENCSLHVLKNSGACNEPFI